MAETDSLHKRAREMFDLAVAAAKHRQTALPVSWHGERTALSVAGSSFDLLHRKNVYGIAIGKAAGDMAHALDQKLGNKLTAGLIAVPSSALTPKSSLLRWQTIVGGHPLPNEESLAAAQAAISLLGQADREGALVIFLVSGGGSAAIEWPCNDRINLEDLREANRLLISCGASISEINAVRRTFSSVKGGKLAARAPRANKITLIVSDVNSGDESNVASGPTLPPPADAPNPHEVVRQYRLDASLPASILEAVNVAVSDPLINDVANHASHVLLDNQSLIKEIAAAPQFCDLRPETQMDICEQPIEIGCKLMMDWIPTLLQKSRDHAMPASLISGGEFSCPVRGNGIGGRNLETVLRCAIVLDERCSAAAFGGGQFSRGGQPHVVILSAGTDGVDGNSPVAGAIADETTVSRGRALGLDAKTFLRNSNSFSYFNALGDAIVTGPTGTNVRDLRIVLATN